MPKEKQKKKATQLRHTPLGKEYEEKPLRNKSTNYKRETENDEELELQEEEDKVPEVLGNQIFNQARDQRIELITQENNNINNNKSNNKSNSNKNSNNNNDSDSDYDDNLEEDEEGEELVEYDGEYVDGNDLTEAEEALVHRFLDSSRQESRTLADIIMSKMREKEVDDEDQSVGNQSAYRAPIPPKVVEVYTMVGKMLKTYKSGKLPKALKMLPHLKNWEEVLWLTRPDEWSPSATYACTRIFASNLNVKMAQRFYSIVLLEKCREDIRTNNKLNYHLYMALKKALFKPGAFYKGLLLPLADSQTCTLREAVIIGSVLSKVSIPGNHSAAALLRLSTMTYSGSTSLFIKILINKKYALPRRVVDSLVEHFVQFKDETRALPVLWHQALLAFAQRYKFELTDEQRNQLKLLLRVQQHHLITPEIRRELFTVTNNDIGMSIA